ncbi:MAG TPA: hypothetical protein VMP01_25100 [Pirellulaceae bacterium]|nr:hypothetical protein [Pirellulaceae bacterium]
MAAHIVDVDGHSIRLEYSLWNGKERVLHDGTVVADIRSYRLTTAYSIEVQERGTAVRYDIRNAGVLGYSIWRNGGIVGRRYRPVVGYFMSVGLVVVALFGIELALEMFAALADPVSPVARALGDWAVPIALVASFPGGRWLKKLVSRPVSSNGAILGGTHSKTVDSAGA